MNTIATILMAGVATAALAPTEDSNFLAEEHLGRDLQNVEEDDYDTEEDDDDEDLDLGADDYDSEEEGEDESSE